MAVLSSPWQIIISTPPVTRAFTAVLLVLSLGYQYLAFWTGTSVSTQPYTFSWLVLRPGDLVYNPWTLVTSSFVEPHLIELFFALIAIPPSLRYLERLWGSIETIKFILVTCGISNVISVGVSYLTYTVFGGEQNLYGTYYRGTMALQTGILVAFTQLIPEHQVQLFGVLKVRVKRLPMAYVGFSNVMCLLGMLSPYILIQFGWLVSWVYLRFYKRTSIEGAQTVSGIETWGDRSDTFAFVHWFPPFVHYPVGILSDVVYKGAVKLKLVREYPTTDLEAGGYAPLGSGNTRAEAERRRAMALRALDQRMAASNASNKPPRATTEANGDASAGPSRQAGIEMQSIKPAATDAKV